VVSCSAGFIDHSQLTIDHLSFEIHPNDSEAYFIGMDMEPKSSIIS